MEYMREEKEDGEMEKHGGDQMVARGRENGADEKGAKELKPQEAWVPMKTEPVKDDTMQKHCH